MVNSSLAKRSFRRAGRFWLAFTVLLAVLVLAAIWWIKSGVKLPGEAWQLAMLFFPIVGFMSAIWMWTLTNVIRTRRPADIIQAVSTSIALLVFVAAAIAWLVA